MREIFSDPEGWRLSARLRTHFKEENEFMKNQGGEQRFQFGKNWKRFIIGLNEKNIAAAEATLKKMLGVENFHDRKFIDIGSGSGVFSLAARRLGAQVHSFDYDPYSVACTSELKSRYFPNDTNWIIEEGSALNEEYLQSLGRHDFVYSWGVLHHTGSMWDALKNVCALVSDEGCLYIAIYNDQGKASKRWLVVKSIYNRIPIWGRFFILVPACIRLWGPTLVRDLIRGTPFYTWNNYWKTRGMSPWRDVVDWVGGYPFEVARPEEIIEFFQKRDFLLQKLITCGRGHGCNEFVFRRASKVAP